MDPISIFSVVIKLVMFLPNSNYDKDISKSQISRTEIIEVYRKEIDDKVIIKNSIVNNK